MVLQLEHITKFYWYGRNKQLVIDDFSVKFPRLGMVAILGKSGSGKSTLLNIIAGIEQPSTGKVLIDGHGLEYHKIHEYQGRYISYVYQFYNLIESLTVRENLLLLPEIKGKKVSLARMKYLTDKLAVTSLLEQYPHELSGGQKQRVGLIRAFLCDTPILLADEPTGALNNKLADEVMKLLKEYAKKHLVIIISHNHNLVKKYTNLSIDLDKKLNVYDFNQQISYHKYFFFISNKTAKINFYLKRQLIYQKNKILMMFCSQIFTICAFVLLVSATNGGGLYLQSCFESNPLKEIIEINKKDYQDLFFTDEQFNRIKKDKLINQLDYKLDFNLGIFKTDQELKLNSYQIYNEKYINYVKGDYPIKNNQVLINQTVADKYHLGINDKIDFIINDKRYIFNVCAIINDFINSGTNIYFESTLVEPELKDQIIDKSVLISKCKNIKQLIKHYEPNYFLINFHQEYLDNYQILFELAIMVVICFLVISFMISLILISIILKTILIERKRDICLMLSNGLPIHKARQLFSRETSLIGGLIGSMGAVLSILLLQILSFFEVGERLFSIPKLFVLPKIILSQFDVYFLMILIYMCLCFGVGIVVSFKIKKMDMSILLKED